MHKHVGEVGTILAFLTYFTSILTAMLSISKIFTIISRGQVSGERIAQILLTEDERHLERKRPVSAAETEEEHYVAFEHVSFFYFPGKEVLFDISFRLKKGETLGVIGETGAGKTTLVSLLLGFTQKCIKRSFNRH